MIVPNFEHTIIKVTLAVPTKNANVAIGIVRQVLEESGIADDYKIDVYEDTIRSTPFPKPGEMFDEMDRQIAIQENDE